MKNRPSQDQHRISAAGSFNQSSSTKWTHPLNSCPEKDSDQRNAGTDRGTDQNRKE